MSSATSSNSGISNDQSSSRLDDSDNDLSQSSESNTHSQSDLSDFRSDDENEILIAKKSKISNVKTRKQKRWKLENQGILKDKTNLDSVIERFVIKRL